MTGVIACQRYTVCGKVVKAASVKELHGFWERAGLDGDARLCEGSRSMTGTHDGAGEGRETED